MNLIDPQDVATALKPLLDTLETRINDAIQGALDRIHGAKITVTIELPTKPQ